MSNHTNKKHIIENVYLKVKLASYFILAILYVWLNNIHANEYGKILDLFPEPNKVEIAPYDNQLRKINYEAKTYFSSLDGRYLFAGPVIDVNSRLDLVQQANNSYRKNRIQGLSHANYLSFPATTKHRKTVTLFADLDCTFCRKFHSYMDEYNSQGITVNYIMLPRAGIGSKSYLKAKSALCSSNPQKQMTLAMAGKLIESKSCNTTLEQQFELSLELGFNSTPTIILPNGSVRMGFVSPIKLLELLRLKKI